MDGPKVIDFKGSTLFSAYLGLLLYAIHSRVHGDGDRIEYWDVGSLLGFDRSGGGRVFKSSQNLQHLDAETSFDFLRFVSSLLLCLSLWIYSEWKESFQAFHPVYAFKQDFLLAIPDLNPDLHETI